MDSAVYFQLKPARRRSLDHIPPVMLICLKSGTDSNAKIKLGEIKIIIATGHKKKTIRSHVTRIISYGNPTSHKKDGRKEKDLIKPTGLVSIWEIPSCSYLGSHSRRGQGSCRFLHLPVLWLLTAIRMGLFGSDVPSAVVPTVNLCVYFSQGAETAATQPRTSHKANKQTILMRRKPLPGISKNNFVVIICSLSVKAFGLLSSVP